MSDLFNEKAADWDKKDLPRQLSAAIGPAIVNNIVLHRDMEVMDFGAGTGLISAHVAPLVSRIVALDTSAAMLEKLLAKTELQGKVEAVCQNIIDKPLLKQFDLIMSAMAMHHVADTDKLIQRFAEHLKTGAMLALADLDKEDGSFHPEATEGVFHAGFERDDFQKILHRHGFSDIRFVTAHTVVKQHRSYPIFLAIASKSGDDN